MSRKSRTALATQRAQHARRKWGPLILGVAAFRRGARGGARGRRD